MENKLAGYKKLLNELPEVNKSTLKEIIWHLHSIDSTNQKNSMPAKNIAPIWGPTLMTVEVIIPSLFFLWLVSNLQF